MGKTKSKVKTVIALILLGVLVLNFVFIFYYLDKNKKLVLEIDDINVLLANIGDHTHEKLKLESEIAWLVNLDVEIINKKEEFFKNVYLYENLVLEKEGSKKIAYITIDDGPYNITSKFLDILDKYDVLATFFVLGKPNSIYDATYERIATSGHTIGNHTYTHDIFKGLYTNTDSFISDVLRLEKFLYDKVGVKTNIVRFPGGSLTASSNLRNKIIPKLRDLNYGYIDWNVSTGDAGSNPNVDKVYKNVINNLGNKDIVVILMHDFSSYTLKALPSIIEELERRDYILLPLFYESSTVKK